MSERPSLLQLIPAAHWWFEDRNGERVPVAAFALVSDEDEQGHERLTIKPLIAADDVIELPDYPGTLRQDSEIRSGGGGGLNVENECFAERLRS